MNVRLLDKTDGCQWLSSEEKSLVWDDGSPIRTIGAKGNKTMFHLAFSQQRLARYQVDYISSLYCGIAKKRVKYDL